MEPPIVEYDLVVVGGGLGGSALAACMAQAGANVLVLERVAHYRDRVRGEGIFPWGCEEARRLGLLDVIRSRCGHDISNWTFHSPDGQQRTRDLSATAPSGLGMVNFRHERMQEVLADLAAEKGAEIRHGVDVIGVVSGPQPAAIVRTADGSELVRGRLIVGADGRASRVRDWAGFEVRHAPDLLVVASTLYEDVTFSPDAVHVSSDPANGRVMLVYPLGDGVARTYLIHRSTEVEPRFSGKAGAAPFLDACRALSNGKDWFNRARQASVLASFEAASSWIEMPYRDGIVLIGDAAGASDPAFGCGLAMTLRDVRLLRDCLVAENDWRVAAERYAIAHNHDFNALKRIIDWRAYMAYAQGDEADAIRRRAQPLWQADPSRVPDVHGWGPDAPSDEAARRRYFALD